MLSHTSREEVKNLYIQIFKNLLPLEEKVVSIGGFQSEILTFPTKDDMCRGTNRKVVRSISGLMDLIDAGELSHMTFNSLKFKALKNRNGRISGFSEGNLFAINSFVVDIDVAMDSSELINRLIDADLFPSVILRTDKGYQLQYVLSESKYASDKVLGVAKRVSTFIRSELEKVGVQVDLACNHFGLSRALLLENIVEIKGFWSFEELGEISNLADSKQIGPKVSHRQVDDAWFNELIKTSNVPIGIRNTALYTLALACMQSEITYEDAVAILSDWNEKIEFPLSKSEIFGSIKSAYLGRFQGASRAHIKFLIGELNLAASVPR